MATEWASVSTFSVKNYVLTREEYIPSIFSRYLVTVINSVAGTGSPQV